jgi:hypothetical protein
MYFPTLGIRSSQTPSLRKSRPSKPKPAKGWPAELLWSQVFWDLPRGLASVLDPDDEIADVTPDVIQIVRMRRDILRFRRSNA